MSKITNHLTASAWLLLCSCGGELVVGENRCYGEGVACKSDAPTLSIYGDDVPSATEFDVAAARMVTPTWIDDLPCEVGCGVPEIAPAYDGGLWAATFDGPSELHRLNAEGEIVDTVALSQFGWLTTNEDRDALLLSWGGTGPSYTLVNGRGDVARRELTASGLTRPPLAWQLAPGPDGGMRLAAFEEHGAYVAEYDGLGELVWKQPDLRVADVASAPPGTSPLTYSQLLSLSDGALALVLPLHTTPPAGLVGLSFAQGVVLLESDGNVRWYLEVGQVSSVLAASGSEGSLVLAFPDPLGDTAILHVDRDGNVAGRWTARRVGYYGWIMAALATDAAGDIYMLGMSGERDTPVQTVCRIHSSDPAAEPACLGVDALDLPANAIYGLNANQRLVAPEVGAAVFTLNHANVGEMHGTSRLVRVDF
jgi:hypothetical protein